MPRALLRKELIRLFGYIVADPETLTPEEKDQYQALYCGLCRQLYTEYGNVGRMTLTYDMTFLGAVLASLYDAPGKSGKQRCPAHPRKEMPYLISEMTAYAADMNILLAWHQRRDDWADDRNILALAQSRLLQKGANKARERWPLQSAAIDERLRELIDMEKRNVLNPDPPAACFGDLMGALFVRQKDEYAPALWRMGAALGSFVYLMDACLDLSEDIKRRRYNPLIAQPNADFTPMLAMFMGECTAAFETLPLTNHVSLLRNILYSGVWIRANAKKRKVSE